MLTLNEESLQPSAAASHGHVSITEAGSSGHSHDWQSRIFRVDWIGQMAASGCWIASVFCYGISSIGDGLQLAAACSWMVANVASVMPEKGA